MSTVVKAMALILVGLLTVSAASEALALNPQPLPPGAHKSPGRTEATNPNSSPTWGSFFATGSSCPMGYQPSKQGGRTVCEPLRSTNPFGAATTTGNKGKPFADGSVRF